MSGNTCSEQQVGHEAAFGGQGPRRFKGVIHATNKRTSGSAQARKDSGTKAFTLTEATTSVKTAAPAMRAGMGKVRLAERSSEQQNSCSSSRSPS